MITDETELIIPHYDLRRLEGEQDKSWAKVAEAVGL